MHAFGIILGDSHARLPTEPNVHVLHNEAIARALSRFWRPDVILMNYAVIDLFLVFEWRIWYTESLC